MISLSDAKSNLIDVGRTYLIGYDGVYVHKHPTTDEDVLVVVVDVFYERAKKVFAKHLNCTLGSKYAGHNTFLITSKDYYKETYRSGFVSYDPSAMYGKDWNGTPYEEDI